MLFPYLFLIIVISLILFIGLLISIAFLTLIERRFIGSTQNRKGPNVVGYEGLLQPFADALKLIIKESIFPRNSKFIIFIISPLISLFFALLAWAFIPFSYTAILVDVNIGLFFIFTTSILHVYGIILAGWSSGSRYSFLGALRSTAQLVAYDISIGTIICTLALYTKSLNLIDIVNFQDRYGYFAFYLPALFSLFLTSSLAETNRHPFDLPEAESELVGGYTTEYSSSYFAYFFLGEYCSILLMVFLLNHLFLGGWTMCGTYFISFFFYLLKLLVLYYFFLIIRAAIPRYRYDQLMRLGWKFILPLCLSLFFLVAIIILFTTEYYNLDLLSYNFFTNLKKFFIFFSFSPDDYMFTSIHKNSAKSFEEDNVTISYWVTRYINYNDAFIKAILLRENSFLLDYVLTSALNKSKELSEKEIIISSLITQPIIRYDTFIKTSLLEEKSFILDFVNYQKTKTLNLSGFETLTKRKL